MFRLIPLLLVACLFGGCVSANQHVALREAYDRVLAEKQQAMKEKAELTREKMEVTKELESAKAALASHGAAPRETKSEDAGRSPNSLQAMEAALKDNKAARVTRNGEESLTVDLGERLLYEPGSVEVTPEGMKLLKRIADVLKGAGDKNIRVEGHTDDMPVKSKRPSVYRSSWELSAARAIGIVRYLEKETGLSAAHLSAMPHASNVPVGSNAGASPGASFRRMAIIVTPARVALTSGLR
jgi:chemotaxis protein MotB